MRTVGVIAEYNPFHPGHAYQLQEARRLSGADCVAVVMSSCFSQRGDAAILSPSIRAQMALMQGADAVFALPACWAVRDAEHFALGGVRLLQMMNVDAISFGAENADLSLLYQAAELLEHPTCIADELQLHLQQGLPYPAALYAAAEARFPTVGSLLTSPNNTLAICYLRAMLRLNSRMEAFPVLRTTDYHATAVETIPSATALRGALERGDWSALERSMPESTFALLMQEAQAGRLHRAHALDQALMYRLRTMSAAEWKQLPDLSEGIEDRLRKAAQQAASRESLLQTAKTRRYPYARLSRLCTHALLQLTQDQLMQEPLPDALWLLGFRDTARPLLKSIKQQGVPVINKASAANISAEWFRTEIKAYDLWALGCRQSSGLAVQQGVVRL